jgi:hypothetical protein
VTSTKTHPLANLNLALGRNPLSCQVWLVATVNDRLAENFCADLDKHRHRIINYQYHQVEQICSIGSGAVESIVKQIDRRTKISAAQWKEENIPQVLAHRCAYLNGLILVG